MSHVNTRFATSPARVLRNRLAVMGIALLTALAMALASAPSGFAASAAGSADHGSKAKRCSHAKRTHDGRRCAKKTRHKKSRRTQPHRPAPPSAGQGPATTPPATSVTGSGGQAAAACGAGVHCAVASCPNGAHNPPDCTVSGGPQGPITAGNPACSGGVSQLAFEYWNGWERFAHWSTCGYWLDQYWTDWSWAQSDYEYWRDQHFIALWPGRGY
jgi:hypothetical protein